uniref:HTH arsR-type domain-containing protein n=1 Tax=Oryza meridionalis TaxID=40149 RepID=A0A0E0C3W3_9ORYZ
MATPAYAAVKCLNTSSSSRKRFVFKSFSQRVEEIDIDVYRSLHEVKAEPSSGSSFFLDALVEWRELNTADDFISFYEETIHLVQTLPQIVLHCEKIFSGLLKRINMKARLSLEPILMLVAALSRDILEDFLPHANAILALLSDGGDRDPEIMEQVFTSWSYVMMYLQKYLVKDVVQVLRITAPLRIFPKDYVREFMAESVSFVLRNAPNGQQIEGVRNVLLEAAKNPSPVHIDGITALLCHVMRGTYTRLHSRAGKIMEFLLSKSNLTTIQEKFPDEINICIKDGYMDHLKRLIDFLTFALQNSKQSDVADKANILKLVKSLVSKYMLPGSCTGETSSSEVVNSVLDFLLCVLDVPVILGNLSFISPFYDPVFKLTDLSMLVFVRKLLTKGPKIIQTFESQILSAMDNFLETSPEEVLFILLHFFKRAKTQITLHGIDGSYIHREKKVCKFIESNVSFWLELLEDIVKTGNHTSNLVNEKEAAILWGSICCYPNIKDVPQVSLSMLNKLICNLDRLLEVEAESISGLPKTTWRSLLGAALSSYHELQLINTSISSEIGQILSLAKKHSTSPQVLSAIAEYLDSLPGAASLGMTGECDQQNLLDLLSIFAVNLSSPNKDLRVLTLRILSYFGKMDQRLGTDEERPHKRQKTEDSGDDTIDMKYANVLDTLLAVESTPISVSTSRKIAIFVSRIQMSLSSKMVHEDYIPLLLHGIIGVLYNRFSDLWPPALDCLAVLISKHKELVWDQFIQFIATHQSNGPTVKNQDKLEATIQPQSIFDCFSIYLSTNYDCTPLETVATLLLQSLQKISDVAESRSRHLVPLFLTFMGYDNSNITSVDSYISNKCKGKQWKTILKEWLNVLRLMRNARSLYQSKILQEVLTKRVLDESDPDIQSKALDCLLNWKDEFLTPYSKSLKNLIDSKTLREELTTWAVSYDSLSIQKDHRSSVVPLVIRVLTPKLRKFKLLGSRKHTGVSHRKAILRFLMQFDSNELQLFFSLLLKSLIPGNLRLEIFGSQSDNLLGNISDIVEASTEICLENLTWKKANGFLHLVEEIFGTFGMAHISPVLDVLLLIVVRLLESCMRNLSSMNEENYPSKQSNGPDDECSMTMEAGNSMSLKEHSKDLPSADHNKLLIMLVKCNILSVVTPISYLTVMQESVSIKQLKDLRCGVSAKILNALNPLLATAGLELRLCICDIYVGLSFHEPSVSTLAMLVRDLNAVSTSELGEVDYDTRIKAYDTIQPQSFLDMREEHVGAILSHCVYDMSSEELIFRQSASRALQSFLDFSASIMNNESKHCIETENNSNGIWTKGSIHQILEKTYLHNMGVAMSKDISIQKEWIILLREMVYNFNHVPSLNSFIPLCKEDLEEDFFHNITHLQAGKRSKALSLFKQRIKDTEFSEDVTMKVFVPLFFNMFFDVKAGKGEQVRDVCLDTLSSIAAKVQWEHYRTILMRCFRELSLKPDKQKIILRLICAVLDSFHFMKPAHDVSRNSDAMNEDSDSSLTFSSTIVSSEKQHYLQKIVFPQVQKLLGADPEKVNVSINLVALKILKLLPVDYFESQLSSIIHRICNFLKNRLESIRDEARSALAASLKELGIGYLQFVVKILRAILKRGYELHVLGYTLHYLLSKTITSDINGRLNYCLEDLLAVVESDTLGDVAEQKEVEKIASKMKETKKRMSLETLKLISQCVTFKTHSLKLISPISSHLQKHLTPKLKTKLEMMLHNIALGIECNPSTETFDLFVFVYGLIKDTIAAGESQCKENAGSGHGQENTRRNKLLGLHDSGLQNSYIITKFAVALLRNRLKSIKLHKDDEELLSKLDPFVKLLAECLSSKHESVLSISFRCLALLIKLPLPSLKDNAILIKNVLMDIAQRAGNSNGHLVTSCLKLLADLLRGFRISLSDDQLQIIVHFPIFVDLQTNPSPVALSLLKAIVKRKLVSPEIYDIVVRIGELMVTTQTESIRQQCIQILLQFFLNYPLSEKRLQQHIDFFLANLSYEHPSGREAVLEMLHDILTRFPQRIVDEQGQTFFLHLVVALSNEQHQNVSSMILRAIQKLLGRIGDQGKNSIFEYTLSWYTGEKQNLWSASAQVIGLLVGDRSLGIGKHLNNILANAKQIMECSVIASGGLQVDLADETCLPFWKESYHSIAMMEKLLARFPELYFKQNMESKREKKFDGKSSLLIQPSMLFLIAVSLLKQLRAELSDTTANNLIRMGKIAMQMQDTQMKIVFNCFSMISSALGAEVSLSYANLFLGPLYKVCEGFAGKVISDDVKQLADSVRDKMCDLIGTEKFVEVYNSVRKGLKQKRESRKQSEKLIAAVDPARHAKRKLRIAAKHREHKRRKIMTMKMGRWLR